MEGHRVRGAPGLRSGEELWVAGRIAVKATSRLQETASPKERDSPLSSPAFGNPRGKNSAIAVWMTEEYS